MTNPQLIKMLNQTVKDMCPLFDTNTCDYDKAILLNEYVFLNCYECLKIYNNNLVFRVSSKRFNF